MNQYESMLKCAYQAISELNEQREEKDKILQNENLQLFGSSSQLDSLGLINYLVLFESKLRDELNIEKDLNDPDLIEEAILKGMNLKSYIEYIISK